MFPSVKLPAFFKTDKTKDVSESMDPALRNGEPDALLYASVTALI